MENKECGKIIRLMFDLINRNISMKDAIEIVWGMEK